MCVWTNKIALIIHFKNEEGIEILKMLIEVGMIVVGFVSIDDFEELSKLLQESYSSEFDKRIKLYKCDLTNIGEIHAMFAVVKHVHGGVDVLINNAHYNTNSCLINGELKNFKKIIDVNVNAVIACTRLSIECMIERKTRGHIIFLDYFKKEDCNNSVNTVYFTSSAAVTSINEILRHELRYLNANIKTTYVTIEEVQTKAKTLAVKDIVQVIKMILDTPEHLHIHEILIDSSFV